MAVAVILLLMGVWFGGDFLVTQRATATYVENKESPTRTVRLLSLFANSHRFWGRKYVDAKISELGPAAEEERQRMLAEYTEVQADLGNASREDEFRLSRAQNFLKRYQTIFDDTEQYRSIAQRASELELIVLTKEENSQVDSAVDVTKDLEAKGHIKAAMDLCDTLATSLKTADAKQRLQTRRDELVGTWISARLKALDASIRPDDPASLVQAQSQLENIQKTVGATPELAKRQKAYDAALWEYYQSKSAAALQSSSFNAARAYAQQYSSESRLRYHVTDVTKLVADITTAEDDKDWTNASVSANQNIRQRAFPLAHKDVAAYRTKWPDGRYKDDANALAEEVTVGHFQYVYTIEDIDRFNDEFKTIRELYAREQAGIAKLRGRLCWVSHQSIVGTLNDAKSSAAVKVAQLTALKFSQCEPASVTYLKEFVNRAVDYLQAPTVQGFLAMKYWSERPPADCVKVSSLPTVYYVTITSISVEMSGAHYSELKGKNNANPRLEIGYGTGFAATYVESAQQFNIDGPVNRQSFSISTDNGKPMAFFLDTANAESVRFGLADADGTAWDAPTLGVTYASSGFRSDSRDKSYTWDNGTKITVSWTAK